MIRGLLFVLSALAYFAGGVQSASAQSNEYHWVNVCNQGDVDLQYVVLRTRWNLGQGDRAQLSGWHTIRKGKCEDVNTSVYQGIAIGFTHALMNGGVGNPVYHPQDAQAASGNKRAPAVLCVPQSGAINRKGSLSSVLSAASPPCSSGTYPLRMSFYSKPGEYAPIPKFIIKPTRSASLAPWPEERQVMAPAAPMRPKAQTSSRTSMDAKLKEGHAQKRRGLYADLCNDSLLATYFQMNATNAQTGCACLSAKLVAGESEVTLTALEENMRPREFQLRGDPEPDPKQFSEVLDRVVGKDKTSQYITQCVVAVPRP
jgi:hypothetical protein